jgi:urease accessory protein
MSRRCAAAILVLVATAGPACAHRVIEGVGGFYGGFLHPVLNPAHALGLVGLGLFLGRQRELVFGIVIFGGSLAAGLFAISLGTGATPAEAVLVFITFLLGVSLAAAWSPPRPAAAILAGGAGLAIGLDSPPQAITLAEGNAMLAGTELGACLVLAIIAFAGRFATHKSARLRITTLGVRIVGSWIAASAMLFLAMLYAG